ncbi:hypothetical protein AAMO2058_000554400 [Amorphochlora amoebiformis]
MSELADALKMMVNLTFHDRLAVVRYLLTFRGIREIIAKDLCTTVSSSNAPRGRERRFMNSVEFKRLQAARRAIAVRKASARESNQLLPNGRLPNNFPEIQELKSAKRAYYNLVNASLLQRSEPVDSSRSYKGSETSRRGSARSLEEYESSHVGSKTPEEKAFEDAVEKKKPSRRAKGIKRKVSVKKESGPREDDVEGSNSNTLGTPTSRYPKRSRKQTQMYT